MSTYHDLEVQKIQLNIGPYKATSLNTTKFGLDGGAMFGTVPKVLWSKTNPSDDQNRILMECRCLLLESSQKNENGMPRKILIDTGLGADFEEKYGPKLGPKFSKMYAVGSNESGIEKALKEHGIACEEITDVILTHLHFDHAGGATKFDQNKKDLVATFKNATYYIQKENLNNAKAPNMREKASYYSCNFSPLSSKLKILDGACEILDSIRCTISNGHTKGQQNIWVESDQNSLLYCADLIPTATHVRLPWIMGYDLDPLLIIEEKRKALAEAIEKDMFIFFEHDPYCEAAKVTNYHTDFRLDAIFNLL